jgi:hypothetical protein
MANALGVPLEQLVSGLMTLLCRVEVSRLLGVIAEHLAR